MERPQRGVVARVESGRLFPQRVLARQPGRAVPDLGVREARLAEASGEVYLTQPRTQGSGAQTGAARVALLLAGLR